MSVAPNSRRLHDLTPPDIREAVMVRLSRLESAMPSARPEDTSEIVISPEDRMSEIEMTADTITRLKRLEQSLRVITRDHL